MHTAAMEYASQALYLVLIISLPPIVIASVIGILLSLIQAVTQLQEQTLTFGVKLIAVVVSLFLLGGWMVDDVRVLECLCPIVTQGAGQHFQGPPWGF